LEEGSENEDSVDVGSCGRSDSDFTSSDCDERLEESTGRDEVRQSGFDVELTRVEVRDVTVRGRVHQSGEIGIGLDRGECEVERLSSLLGELEFFDIHLVDFDPGVGCRRWRMR